MAKKAVEKILDLQIRSTVNLERYSEDIRRKIIKILNETQDDILAELIKRDTKVPITEWKKGRLTNLQKTINGIVDKSYGQIKKVSTESLNDITSFTAKETVGNLNKVIGAEIANVTLTPEGLKSIVSNTMIDGQIIGKWWDDQKFDFRRKSEKQMADAVQQVQLGMVKGEGINELVRRIRGTALSPGLVDMSKRNATALVRTSVMQVANEARMEMYEGNKDLIDGYEFVATLDKRTCPRCQAYDGKQWIYKNEKLVSKGHRLRWPGNPPIHWVCRCTMIPILKSFADLAGPESIIPKSKIRKLEKLSPTQRAAMTYDENLLGIGKPVSGNMTYNDWLLTQPEAVQIDVLGPGRFRLWKKNKLSAADMVNQKGRPLSIKDLEESFAEVDKKYIKIAEDLMDSKVSEKHIRGILSNELDKNQIDKAIEGAKSRRADFETKYLENPPDHIDAFTSSIDKWTRGVDNEGRIEAAMTFNDFSEVANYLHADLITMMRNKGYKGWDKFRSLEDFRKAKITIYRSGQTTSGYNSFFMDVRQAESYAERFGVDIVGEYSVLGEDLIPTMSGAAEVFAERESIKFVKYILENLNK